MSNPFALFMCSIALSACTAVGSLLLSDKDVSARALLAVVLFHGLVGGAVGMAAYEYFQLIEQPWWVLAVAIGYGAGIVQFKDLRKMVRRVLRSLTQNGSHESKE